MSWKSDCGMQRKSFPLYEPLHVLCPLGNFCCFFSCFNLRECPICFKYIKDITILHKWIIDEIVLGSIECLNLTFAKVFPNHQRHSVHSNSLFQILPTNSPTHVFVHFSNYLTLLYTYIKFIYEG